MDSIVMAGRDRQIECRSFRGLPGQHSQAEGREHGVDAVPEWLVRCGGANQVDAGIAVEGGENVEQPAECGDVVRDKQDCSLGGMGLPRDVIRMAGRHCDRPRVNRVDMVSL
ncbi:hypothetical protein [Nocardia sp.]|uniref:hypothetical protein n=1 Tax=Nocardia sp. TaxID=1821 RepID=UPI00262952D8|nr:hypothetical protein [Nocardia sp.]